jgi:hypothetical protein
VTSEFCDFQEKFPKINVAVKIVTFKKNFQNQKS